MLKKSLKQFGVWATSLKRNIFLYARLRLTGFYILMLALIAALYSTALFLSIKHSISEDFEDRFQDVGIRAAAEHKALGRVREEMLLIDLALLSIIGFAGYALAGKTLRPVAKALEDQKRFSSDASHELRTPLAVMKMELEVALKGRDLSAEATRAVFKSNIEEIDRMSALIEDLLLISRGQAKKVVFEKVDLAALIGRLVKKMAPLAEEKRVSLTFSPGAGLVRGNPAFLERMSTNIIHNAVSYTPAGGRVDVEVRSEKDGVLFCVSDTGVGIAPENLPKVFDRFHRDGNAGETRGTGLGLSIVKEIVRLHNGDLRIESEPGSGTKVFVTIPECRA
jgi:signal transduction histidine kinase